MPPDSTSGPAIAPGERAQEDGAPVASLALALLATCQLVLVVDASIVNIALPSIQSGLHFSDAGLSWVVNAYTLAFGGLLLIGGRAGDLLGHRRVFVAGVAVFTVASLAGGFALTPGWLLAARAAQGVGAALAGPGTLALIATTFEDGPRRARALAVFSVVASAGMVAGLVLGGLLIAWTSWRSVMFVNVPIGVAIVLLAPRVLRETAGKDGRFDIAGALTCTLGSTLLVYGFVRAAEHGWSGGLTAGAFGGAAVLLTLFPAIEARAEQPIMPLRLFADRDRVGAFLMRLLLTSAMSGMLFFLTLYVQKVLGYGPLATGFGFLPTTIALIAASRAVPRLLPRYGPQPIMAAGAVLCVAGMVWLTQISATSSYAAMILGPVLLFGAGTGLVAVAATFVAMSSVEAGESGATSALLQSMQQIGGSLGVAVLVTVNDAAARGGSQVEGMRGAFVAGAVFTVLMLVTALLVFRRRRNDQGRSGSQI
ncbi:MFS transporter [Actinomadura barringtoniae]|uniref:MFS transporter n=1 Tax=Actinomadura barringtoniae TaxID=1427535 RepID=A0A939T4A7_9ACTN|nr:MFS transporter [Actinomadura barringtoniae]MBO2445657.1 MFS transporter [Actinomadura barringtoniae]